MSIRVKTSYYVIAIVVLLLAAIAQREPGSTLQQLPALSGFERQKVAVVEIAAPGREPLQLKRSGKGWQVAGMDAEADNEAVEQLLLNLEDMHPKRIATRKSEHHQRFAVTDEDVRVKLIDAKGEILLHLLIGNPATDLTSTYIRIVGEEMVLTVDKILTWQVKRTSEAWFTKEQNAE